MNQLQFKIILIVIKISWNLKLFKIHKIIYKIKKIIIKNKLHYNS